MEYKNKFKIFWLHSVIGTVVSPTFKHEKTITKTKFTSCVK
jgi:hypothetical protein